MHGFRVDVAFGVAALSVVAYVTLLSGPHTDTGVKKFRRCVLEFVDGHPEVFTPIPRLNWTGKALRHHLSIARASPVVLHGSRDVSQWPALRRWSPGWLARAVDKTRVFHILKVPSTEPLTPELQERDLFSTFNGPLDDVVGDVERAAKTEEATMGEFWQRAFGSVQSAVGEGLMLKSKLPQLELSHNVPEVDGDHDVWMSAPSVSTHLHYDLQHNYYTQVSGHKLFLLLSPELAPHVSLFPSIHGRYRSSQLPGTLLSIVATMLNVTEGLAPCLGPRRLQRAELLAKFPLLRSLVELRAVRAAVLGPGDTLYIPPLWLHTGVALTGAVALSVCWPSSIETSVAALEGLPIPFESTWSSAQRAVALRQYVRSMISAELCSVDKSKDSCTSDVLRVLVRSRYEPLLGFMVRSECERWATAPAPSQCVGADHKPGHSCASQFVTELPARIRRGLRSVHSVLRKVDRRWRAILLKNYVEDITAVVFDAASVHSFLHCAQ